MRTDISAGIAAGGKSTRMGTDKALIRIGDERMIDVIIRELKSYPELIISAGANKTYEDTGCMCVYDEIPDIGPIEGIRQILKHASYEYAFICAVDMPYICEELVDYMAGKIAPEYDCIVMTDDEHIHPLCAIYSVRTLPVIEDLIEEKKYRLREIFDRVPTLYLPIEETDLNPEILKNINTPEEHRSALSGPHP